MSGGIIFHTWRGPGDTWPWPNDPSAKLITANQKNRWMPFKDEHMQRMISSGGPNNRSGTSWESQHAGIQTAEEKARSENYKF